MSLPYSLPFSLPGVLGGGGFPIENLSFEVAGVGVGTAELWTRTETITFEMHAVWGPDALDDETFAEWLGADLFVFEPSDVELGIFDTSIGLVSGEEDFEDGWGPVFPALSAIETLDVDGFEDWDPGYAFDLVATLEGRALLQVTLLAGNVLAGDVNCIPTTPLVFPTQGNYPVVLDDGSGLFEELTATGLVVIGSIRIAFSSAVLTGPFSAGPASVAMGAEVFETGWLSNTVEQFDLTSTATALFDLGAETREDFEEAFTPLQLNAVPGLDVLNTSPSHGLVADDVVVFILVGPGRLPEGLLPGLPYVVLASGLTATAFKVSMVSGGAAVDVGDYGFGAFYVGRDPQAFWNIDP